MSVSPDATSTRSRSRIQEYRIDSLISVARCSETPSRRPMASKKSAIAVVRKPAPASRPIPTRSASASSLRVKFIACWSAMPWLMAMAPCIAWPLAPPAAPISIAASSAAVLPSDMRLCASMALAHVRGLVPQHRRQVRFGLGEQDESGIHADEAAVGREGIDLGGADDEILEVLVIIARLRRQPRAQVLDVIGQLGILQDQLLAAQFAHRHEPDLVLIGLAEYRILRRAHVRQLAGYRAGVAGGVGAAGQQQTGQEGGRSEERRVGKECRSRWSPYH